jgi:hypothetical protein
MWWAVPTAVGTVRSVLPGSGRLETLLPTRSCSWAPTGATDPDTGGNSSRWNQPNTLAC